MTSARAGIRSARLPVAAVATALIIGSSFVTSPYRLIYNPSESAPRGWYWEHPTDHLDVNEFALAWLPDPARKLAAARDYLPETTPLLKRVGAVEGQWVCYRDGAIWIDWRRSGWDQILDGRGRPLPLWKGCLKLGENEYFLLSVTSDVSFDSRYFGPVLSSEILGEAVPLWTR